MAERKDTRGPIGAAALEELRTHLGGRVIGPADGDYNGARAVWNGMIDRHPVAIVRCVGVADVLAAVRFARSHNLVVAVRGGGHNVAGFGTCDGGMVIDLSPMKGVRVDPQGRTAHAQPGLSWGEFEIG